MGLGLSTFEIVLIIVGGIIALSIAIKYGAIPEYMEEMEKRQNIKKQKEQEANSKQYIIEKARLQKYINKEILTITAEYQVDILRNLENQFSSDLSYDRSTWTTTADIDNVVAFYLRKSNSQNKENGRTDLDILNKTKERGKEKFQEMRKRRRAENE